MEFRNLFNAQQLLMDRIEKEHPPAEDEDRFQKRVLALLVEVGECANEQRKWKYWSNDQEPRVKAYCDVCDGEKEIFMDIMHIDCPHCEGTGIEPNKNPLLEELVDVLHFVLELGLVTDSVHFEALELLEFPDVAESLAVEFFLDLYESIYIFKKLPTKENYTYLIGDCIFLASALGFNWEEVEQAYFDKNAVNHSRQDGGY